MPRTTAGDLGSFPYRIVAWGLIVAVWICTPFINDRVPTALEWGYTTLTVVAVVFGAAVAIRSRAWILLILSILTAFAWPILLMVAFAFGRIN